MTGIREDQVGLRCQMNQREISLRNCAMKHLTVEERMR